MAEIEPSKIWASTGIIVAVILGMTTIQLRSTRSSSSEVPGVSNVTSTSQSLAAPLPSPSSSSTTYEVSYIGSGSRYIPLSFRTNPLSLPAAPGYVNVRPLSVPTIDERDEPESDVEQELLEPEFSQTDVAATIGDAPEGELSTDGLTGVTGPSESLVMAVLSKTRGESSESLIELARQEVQPVDFQAPAVDGLVDYDVLGDGEPPMLVQADNIDYTKTGILINGNVSVTTNGSGLGYAYNPQQAQQLYFTKVITGNVSAQQAQAMAYQQAVAQFAPQNSNQTQAMAAEQAVLQQQAAESGQQSLIDQQIYANLVARAQYEAQVQQAANQSFSKQMIDLVELSEEE